jgi:hypothetical protein
MDIAKGGLLGGVYAYLDNNQMVLIDGTNHLLRIAHSRDERGAWHLVVTESTDLFSAIPSGDSSFGVVPDYLGNVWFATAIGVVGVSKIGDGVARISPGEQVANSIPASPKNPVAVATTFALYKSISTAWATRRPYLRTWPRPQAGAN